jgi:hypothetical protein
MVEFAIAAGLLFSLIAGVVDLGVGWRRSIEVSSTLRGGGRVVSNLGRARQADQEALRAINAGIAEIGAANVTRVIIYKSTTANGSLPASCDKPASASGTGVSGLCNVYGPAQLAALSSSSTKFSGSTTSCQADDWDQWYCPLAREDRQGVGADFVGIYMEFTVDWIFGFMPSGLQKGTDDVVMRIEPTG